MALLKVVGDIVASNTITGNNIAANTISAAQIRNDVNIGGPRISSISYVDDNTAADTAGGETITISGGGFLAGATVLIEATAVSVTTVVNSNTITFTAPAKSAGSYIIYVVNTDGSTAILVPGIQYSGTPTWTTSAGSLGTFYETVSFANTVAATGDGTITYSLLSGALPTGATINSSNGTISGSAPLEGGSSTYTFTLNAVDAQNQETSRQFSITINTDPVTWSAPANNATITTYEYVAIPSNTFIATSATGKNISYSANVLPANVSISGAVVSGTPNTVGNTTSLVTATAATTGRTSTRTLNFVVQQDAVTWSAPANNATITTYEYVAIPSNTLVSTSAAGFNVSYTANVLPANVTLSGSTISGTPNTVGNTTTLLTSTAATTGRTNTQTLNFVVQQDVVTWGSPANNTTYTLPLNAANTISLSATSAAGFNVSYAANSLPTGLSVSGATITGTPTAGGNTTSLVTATAATTGRTSTLTLNWVIAIVGDSYWKTTSLLLSANTSQPNTFNQDSSLTNATITPVNDTRPSKFNPYQNGYYGTYYDGTTDYLTTPVSSAFLCAGDFTVECWFNTPAVRGSWTSIINQYTASGGWSFELQTTGLIDVYYTGTTYFQTTIAIIPGGWNHLALVRSGSGSNNLVMYVNGIAAGSTTHTGNFGSSTSSVFIGMQDYSSAGSYNGYISNVRFINGTAAYTSNFTPSTTPLTATSNTVLLTCQSNRLIDNSPRRFAITKNGDTTVVANHPFITPTIAAYDTMYSTYHDGSGDYMLVADNSNFEVGLNVDFTIEGWFNIQSLPSSGNFADIVTKGAAGVYEPYYLFVNSAGNLAYYSSSDGASWNIANGTNLGAITPGTWYHFAISRQGTNTRLFVNGALITTIANSGAALYNNASAFGIGGRSDGTETAFVGSISNVRMVNGTAVYTSAFTPPTSPLTAIANTVLLTCQDATIKDNSTNNFTITSYGDVRPIASSPFTTTTSNTTLTSLGSTYFDGTSDYLTIPSNPAFGMGSGDFTVEFWLYQTALSNYKQILDVLDGNSSGRLILWVNSSGAIINLGASGTQRHTSATGAVVINTWTHVALVRSSGTTKFYVNGVASGTPYTDSTTYTCTTGTVYIGCNSDGSTYPFIGHISDFRMVKGTALYKANFLPPQAPLTAVANTTLLTLQSNGVENNTRYVDKTGNTALVTRYGNVSQGTFSPYGDNWSTYFDGTGDYLSIADHADLDGFTGDFTVEFWVYYTGFTGTPVAVAKGWDNGASFAPYLFFVNGGALVFYASSGGSSWDLIQGVVVVPSIQTHTWYHVAMSRSGSTIRFFNNGAVSNTVTSSATFMNSTSAFTVGSAGSGYSPMTGYVSNVRVVKGTAVYTSAFTPPTSPLTAIANTTLLTCHSNRFADMSIDNHTVTKNGDASVQKFSPFSTLAVAKNYSAYFDGTTDYLYASGNTAFTMSTGAFTVEAWIYPSTSISSYFVVAGQWPALTTGVGNWLFTINSANRIELYYDGQTYSALSGATVAINSWNHVAISRSGSTIYGFINGVAAGTITYSGVFGRSDTNLEIGGTTRSGGPIYSTGCISNLRVTKGEALYTSAFTPSTTTLSATSNTQLLTCQSNVFKDNSANRFTMTPSGDTKPTTMSPFAVATANVSAYSASSFGGSYYFDGSGDYLRLPAECNISGTGYSWTIQGWVYPLTTTGGIFDGWNGGSGTSFLLRLSGGALEFYVTGGSNISVSGLTTGRWYHFAIVKDATNSNTITMYLNGTKVGTPITNYVTSVTSNIFGLGGSTSSASPGSEGLTGYISDAQIIKGTALYNGNFYPGETPAIPSNQHTNRSVYSSALLMSGADGGIIDSTRTHNLESAGDVKLVPIGPYGGAYYSNYFDGTGDYLTVPDAAALEMGSGDFTIEFWINYSTIAGYQTIFSKGYTAAGDLLLQTGNGDGKMMAWLSGSPAITESTGASTGKWYHYALVRSGTTVTMYRDGVSVGTATSSVNFNTTNQVGIGATGKAPAGGAVGDYPMTGYLSNLRVVKGVAVYTGAFTPPTSPLSATQNAGTNIAAITGTSTSLLTCQSNKFIDNSTNAYTVTRVGDTAVRSQTPFPRVDAGRSYYFDGTGDYLKMVNSPVMALPNDYTIECWVYMTTVQTCVFAGNIDGSGYGDWAFFYNSTQGLRLLTGNGQTVITGAYTMPANRWVHCAISRSGTTVKIFADGVVLSTTTDSNANPFGGSMYVGRANDGTLQLAGYISDLRVSKNVARYTAAFTPPTAPLDTK